MTSTITAGGPPVTVATNTAGQNARITLSGLANQHVSLQLTGVTIAGSTRCSAFVSIIKPDGTVLVAATYFGTSGGFIDNRTLNLAGTYAIVIDPAGTNTGPRLGTLPGTLKPMPTCAFQAHVVLC